MSLLEVKELYHGYAEKELYKDASFELYKGEHIGIVGQNGTGKSTLIKILLGEVVPDKGRVIWQQGIRIGHLDQYAELDGEVTMIEYLRTAYAKLYRKEEETNRLYEEAAQTGREDLIERASRIQEELLREDFYTVDSRIARVVNGLGLDAVGTEKSMQTLSGGQRAKVILAKLLLEVPDVLLLDEPTNFLDKEHVEWLSEYLSGFEGAYLVVSHDYDFLEKITGGICDIEFGTIRKYHGKYTEFLKQKIHLREDYIRQYHAQQKKIEETEAFIRKNIAGVNTKMAQGRRTRLEKMEKLAPPQFAQKPRFRFREMELLPQAALTAENLEVGYYYALMPKLSFRVDGGQKLVITGFNGIGKSTLLKTIIGQIPAVSGQYHFAEQVKIGYYEQDLVWENAAKTPMEIMADAYPRNNKKELFRFLSQCGIKQEHATRPVSTLSGGEQSKVKLCRLVMSSYNFLILDEPTNHLDAETKEVLEDALKEFTGSVILVSHEEKFYRNWADKILDIENL